MKVTRNVISDLWPAYAAGEASDDTRALVDGFLQQDAEFAAALKAHGIEQLLQQDAPRLPPDHEARALQRTKRLVHGWDWTFFLAMLFSCFAFGRIVADTSWDVSPAAFIITASIAAALWVSFFIRLTRIRKQVFRIDRAAESRKP
jgi:hypothetical protein